MANSRIYVPALLATMWLAACSSMPPANSTLDQARSDYGAAQGNPRVAQFAAGELRQAGDSLLKADTAWRNGDDSSAVTHLAYVARQQVAIAELTASQRSDEQLTANAGAERDRVRLAARTREADLANRNAADSQRQAEASQRNADDLQRQSGLSLRAAEESQRVAAAATQAANDAAANTQAALQRTDQAEQRAQQLEAQLRDMEARPTPRGMVITLGDVLFDSNEARLKSGGMRNVQKLADFFKQYPQRKVMIEGFTDSTGSSNRNTTLSEDRAGAVRTALLDMGVASERIGARGYGEAYPVSSNDTAAGRQLNRRVEIIVSDERGAVAPR
jgi:outer membrane protein OmpA-like peptidoglycan-associated protein